MTWRYEQSTGRLWRLVATGYSGYDPDPKTQGEAGEGKNDPSDEAVRSVGPIPRGRWYFEGPPMDTHGPFVLRILPRAGTDTHGRSGFLLHGDSIRSPGQGSHGCIVMPRSVRVAVWASRDMDLEVVE
jgi:hypothetical protein